MKTVTAGSEVDAWCTKCRLDLSHRVVAMVGTTPKRVECQTCSSQHNYRAPKASATGSRKKAPGKPRTASARATAQARGEALRIAEWENRTLGQPPSDFAKYTVKGVFEQDQLVSHKRFGDGYVLEVLDAAKVSVMFKDGPRTLAQGVE